MRSSALHREAYGPLGDPSRHRSLTELRAGLIALPDAHRDAGSLALIVCRQADGIRLTPARVVLTLEEGVPRDRWSRRPNRNIEVQITVMRRGVAELIANGQPLSLFGDNLFVDLDISAANLPPGTRLRVGEAVVEVTAKPHNGCAKFNGRFGEDALAFVNDPQTRHLNLRGIHWKVIEPGEVTVGAVVRVVARP